MGTYVIDWPNWSRFKAQQGERIMRVTVAECRLVARRYVSWGPYTRGRLAASIYGTVRSTATGYSGQIGSHLNYAASVDRGAQRHIIRPRAISFGGGLYGGGPLRGGMLVFYWHKRGHWVITREVHHPGQKGKHYLERALVEVGRRRGFRVIIH